MAFVVEDGTGLSTATAYVAEAYVDTYQSDRERTEWVAASSVNKQSAIIRATDYIDKRFGIKFVGDKMSGDQALQWPRASAFDVYGHVLSDVPALLQRACAEYSLIALRQGELAPQPPLPVPSLALDGTAGTADATGEITKEKIGPIETEYGSMSERNTDNAARKSAQSSLVSDYYIPEYPVADMMIEQLLKCDVSNDLYRG